MGSANQQFQDVYTSNINQGGLADSALVGPPNSVADMIGLDIHSEPGIIKVNQQLVQESPDGLIDNFIKTGVACSDGNTYLFGSTNGKIWERTPLGVYTLVATAAPAAGGFGIVGSMEYQGYVYYATENRVGRWQIGTAWSTRDDNFATFQNGNATYHPMKLLNLILYIGDGNFVAQVDDNLENLTYGSLVGVFSPGEIIVGGTSGATAIVDSDNNPVMVIKEISTAFIVGETITGRGSGATAVVTVLSPAVFSGNALDLPVQYIITCFGQLGTDLLIGTTIAPNIAQTQIFRWNTWSVSYTNSDPIPEIGINAFLPTENFVIINAGVKGNLYIYNGSSLEVYKTIPGKWTANNQGFVYPEAVLNWNGLPLFGLSFKAGQPATMGLYSLGRANRNYKYVLNCEYILHNNHTNTVSIGTIITARDNNNNTDIFLVTYQDLFGGMGVDKLDVTNKFTGAYFTTRAVMPDRMKQISFATACCGYRILPGVSKITFQKSVNYGTFSPASGTGSIAIKKDAMRNMVYSDVDLGDASIMQLKVNLVSDGNNAPEVDILLMPYRTLPTVRIGQNARPAI